MRLIIMLLTASASVVTASAAQAAPRYIANEYICAFGSNVSRGNVRAESDRAVRESAGQLIHVYRSTIKGFAVKMPADGRNHVAGMKRSNPNIVGCERNQVAEVVVQGKPGGGTTTGEVIDWGVARVGGPGAPVSGRTAWVIDTGIDLDHPDLFVDAGRSRSFIRDTSPDDGNGHGSHVAGTIAAKSGNGIGVAGVAAGARLVAIRVLDRRGSGSYADVIAGVDYVGANGVSGDVANMSLGGGASDLMDNAVINAASKGVRFVLAAGNDAEDANLHSPARAEGANVFTVSSFAKGDVWSSFSNFKNPPIDFTEPGSSIKSTYKDGGYATLSGTSMAAPHLAGILMTGAVRDGGAVAGDPDGNPDRIGIR